jgi:hypothetical protein
MRNLMPHDTSPQDQARIAYLQQQFDRLIRDAPTLANEIFQLHAKPSKPRKNGTLHLNGHIKKTAAQEPI